MITRDIFRVFLVAAVAGTFSIGAIGSAETTGPRPPFNLRCEYLKNPMGLDVKNPRFSWMLDHSSRGQKQTAYQIIVSTDPEAETADMWDSGKVVSGESLHVVYEGQSLESDRTYTWKVRYWDKDDVPSPYSQAATFDTGLFEPEDWEGEWIGGKSQVRKEFLIDGNVQRARAFISGLGYYELRINGRKVGDHVLDPGFTTYEKRVLYAAYDIKPYLKKGPNAVGVMLGKGRSGPRVMILQMNILLESGETLTVRSDGTWRGTDGALIADSIYDGEIYDARLETPGWDLPGYDETVWEEVDTGLVPKGVLSAQLIPPIRIMDTIVPKSMSEPSPGVFVYDMGQNFSGWAELRVSGPRGTRVRLRYAELLYENGMINQENLRSASAQDEYVLKGDGLEIYEPRFTYHGFRYVELTGFPGVPTLDTLRGKVVHTAVRQKGNFSCSHPVLNHLQHMIIWTQKTNLHSIPTDCNQRDERMGWLADAHLTAEEAMMNFDMGAFYTKFIRDIRDVQDKEGTLTDTVPHIWGQRPADPAWGTAYPLLCWYMYRYYGDRRILEDHYDGLKQYVEFLRSKSEENLLRFSTYGDWVSIEETPGDFVSSWYYYYDVLLLARIAGVLDYTAERKSYERLAESIRRAFHEAYFDEESGNYATGSQTANALPLFLDIVPEAEQNRVFQSLVRNILYRNDTHLTTGIIGTKYIMEVLSRYGAAALAYDLATQTTYPSWGYMMSKGATTLWELWQYKTGPSMNSHSHPMFGSVGAWLYKVLAGISQKEDSAGFRNILIHPYIPGGLQYGGGTVFTLRGSVTSRWVRSEQSLTLEVSLPVSTEAEIRIPKLRFRDVVLKESGQQIYDGEKFLTGIEGIEMVEETRDAVVVRVGSGRYAFTLEGK
ncbi:MAG: family 78 glycoside hydrolase catalytic domain [Candidatus Aminicenantales bacterium]